MCRLSDARATPAIHIGNYDVAVVVAVVVVVAFCRCRYRRLSATRKGPLVACTQSILQY